MDGGWDDRSRSSRFVSASRKAVAVMRCRGPNEALLQKIIDAVFSVRLEKVMRGEKILRAGAAGYMLVWPAARHKMRAPQD